MALLYAYNFDEASGNILDQSGNGRDTVFGGSLSRSASGHTGKGISQTSAAADSAGPSITGLQTANCTLMGWVFRTDNSVIGWFGEIKSGGSGNRGILLGLSGNVGFRCRNSGGTAQTPSVAQPAISGWWHVAGTWDGANVKLFINGVQVASTALVGAPHTSGTGSHLMDTLGAETIVDDVRYYDAALDAATITTLMGTPIDSGGTTGTVAVTQDNQTSAASGQLGYTGTSARTQANQTASAAGKLGYSGTAAATQANQTAAATGTFTAGGAFTGTVAVTQAGQTSSASGKLGYSGTVARTQANNTSAASGTVANPVTGTVAATQANQIAAIVGQFAALVAFGTASAAVGQSPGAGAAVGEASAASAATARSASASSGSMTVPTATGG